MSDLPITLFEVGTGWWWLIVGGVSAAVMVCIWYRAWFPAAVLIGVASLAMMLFSDAWAFAKILLVPWRVAKWTLIYLAAGGVWGVLRWALLVLDRLRAYRALRTSFLAARGVADGDVPEALRAEWKSQLAESATFGVWRNGERVVSIVPSPLDQADALIAWAALWPWSAALELLRATIGWAWAGIAAGIAAIASWLTGKFFPEPGDIEPAPANPLLEPKAPAG